MSKEIEDHRILNRSSNEPFSSILEKHVSRRSVMQGGLGVAAMSILGGFGLAGCSVSGDDAQTGELPEKTALALAFDSIRGWTGDAVRVPEGYTAQVLVPWGTPLNNMAPDWQADLKVTPEVQSNSVGMMHDGMWHYPLDEASASKDFLLALNNEYINQSALWAPQGGPTNAKEGPRPPAEVRTEINAHGVTIVRLHKQADATWAHVPNSPYNRRITSDTPMALAGPVRGSQYVITPYSPDGTMTRGTNNNCAHGHTPWGTYLTCEENWPNVFIDNGPRSLDDERLGIPVERSRFGWETAAGAAGEQNGEFARFNTTPTGAGPLDDYRNEARTFGYVVEIDPYSNTSTPVKRTALGRFRHESCTLGKLIEGEPVVFYTGHDSRNEYIYKFVSQAMWDPADANRPGANYDRLAIGAKYMDQGTLYVAKFNADGSGEWLPLTPSARTPDGGTLVQALGLAADDQAGVIIHTADAADIMGATPMDRPEWAAVDPVSGDVYMTLTNNSKRTPEGAAPTFTNGGNRAEELGAGYATAPVNAPNPRPDNGGGQVIRWREQAGSTKFQWAVFVFGAAASDTDNLSSLTELNQFASPDGLWYDDRGDGQGILWIETDNGYDPVKNHTNDQLLAVVPGSVSLGEGDAAVVDASNQQQLKRFAVGPSGCEVTGIFATPDKTALFINIQHPANWPADPNRIIQDASDVTQSEVRPRSSTVVIQRADGGKIGV